MKLKDFIVVTLLGIVGFVVSLGGGMLSQLFGTYGMFVHVSVGSLLCAPIYIVMCHKVAKRGTVFVFYTISGIIYSVMGFVPMLPILLAAGLLGELCVGRAENYQHQGKIGFSYVLSQLIYALHGFFFLLVLGVRGLVETFPNLFTLDMAQMTYDTFFNIKNMAIILSIQLVLSFLGVLFGNYIYRKFFDRNSKKTGLLS